MNRVDGRHRAADGRPETPASGATRRPQATERIDDARSFAFLTTTVDETVLEGRYRAALAAWKDAVKSAHPTDPRDRQRVELLQRAYVEALSALEEARADTLRNAGRRVQMHDERSAAARNAEMLLRQYEARASASDEARRRRGLLARIFRRG